jgi:hypothetical protein
MFTTQIPTFQVSEPAPTLHVTLDRLIVVDGLNLLRSCRWIFDGMQTLLATLLEASRRASDVLCVFDANTPFVLKDANAPKLLATYQTLLDDHGDFFIQSTGGTRADDLLLAEAHDCYGKVVSNDRFRNYQERYRWVTNPGRVLHVNRVRDNVYIGGWRRRVPGDLRAGVAELEANLVRLRQVRS